MSILYLSLAESLLLVIFFFTVYGLSSFFYNYIYTVLCKRVEEN